MINEKYKVDKGILFILCPGKWTKSQPSRLKGKRWNLRAQDIHGTRRHKGLWQPSSISLILVQVSLILEQVPISILASQRRNQIHTEKILVQG